MRAAVTLLILAAILARPGASFEALRQILGIGPASEDPVAPHVLQSGEHTVDLVVPGLGACRGLRTRRVDKFLGIPFAYPPVGARRWTEPQLLRTWAAPLNVVSTVSTEDRPAKQDATMLGGSPLNATVFGPACYSQVVGGSFIRSEVESEDCLTLSVYTPRGLAEAVQAGGPPLPVIVYIHGGGFVLGSSSNPSVSPPPDTLVSQGGVVYVAANWRLGPFAFLSSSAMRGGGGMLGIQDQQAALRWVRRYIRAFGGDPGQVTLMGESAGAISICLHLVLPSSRGLFKKAIMESGLCSFPFADADTGRRTTLALAKATSCYVAPDSPAVAEALDNGTLANPAVSVVEDHVSDIAGEAAASTHYRYYAPSDATGGHAQASSPLGVTHAAAGGTAAAMESALHKIKGRTAARAGVARRAADLAPPPLNIIEPEGQPRGAYRRTGRAVQSWSDIFADWGDRLQRSGAEWSATLKRRQEHSRGHLAMGQPLPPPAGDWQPPAAAVGAAADDGTADGHFEPGKPASERLGDAAGAADTAEIQPLSVLDGVRAVLLHPWTAAASLLPKARGIISGHHDDSRSHAGMSSIGSTGSTGSTSSGSSANGRHMGTTGAQSLPGRTGCRGSERLVRDAGAGGAFVVGRNWRHLARAMCGMRSAGGGNNTLPLTTGAAGGTVHRSRTAQFVAMDAAGTPLEDASGEPPLTNLQLSPEEEALCLDEYARWQGEHTEDAAEACMAAAASAATAAGSISSGGPAAINAGLQPQPDAAVSLEEGKLEAAIAIAEREGIPVLPALESHLSHRHHHDDESAHSWIPAIDDAAVVAASVLRGGQRWLLRAAAALETRARGILARAGHAGTAASATRGTDSEAGLGAQPEGACDEADTAGGATCPSAAERAAATTGHGVSDAGLAETAADAVRSTGSWLRSLLVGSSPATGTGTGSAISKPGAPEHAHPAAVGSHRERMSTAEAMAATQAQAAQPVVYRPLQLSLREMAADEVSPGPIIMMLSSRGPILAAAIINVCHFSSVTVAAHASLHANEGCQHDPQRPGVASRLPFLRGREFLSHHQRRDAHSASATADRERPVGKRRRHPYGQQ